MAARKERTLEQVAGKSSTSHGVAAGVLAGTAVVGLAGVAAYFALRSTTKGSGANALEGGAANAVKPPPSSSANSSWYQGLLSLLGKIPPAAGQA